MGWFRKKLLTGLVILLPTAITLYVIYRVFIFIDNKTARALHQFLGDWIGIIDVDDTHISTAPCGFKVEMLRVL